MAYHIGESCIGCTACAGLCPVMAIMGERRQRHEINEKRCIGCGVCGRLCRNNAITDGNGKVCVSVSRAHWPKPDINKSECSACGICVSVCRVKALRIAPPARKGDIRVTAELHAPTKCVGCALCARECPLGLIVMKEGVGL